MLTTLLDISTLINHAATGKLYNAFNHLLAGWRWGCRAHTRTWRATQIEATPSRQWASASAWPRMPASRLVGCLTDQMHKWRPWWGSMRIDSRSQMRLIQCPVPVCLQVIAHMMPDLPNVGWERDLESFREFFENPAFRSDGLKV